MKLVGITQRVSIVPEYGERRDCLDQAWSKFLAECGLLPLLLPNVVETSIALCEQAGIAGLVLTGGNDLVEVGGDAPERDATERVLLGWAEQCGLPILGVCRGMQVIQQRFSVPFHRIQGHVRKKQIIRINGEPEEVNSYHHFGTIESLPPLEAWAVAGDGVVKAICHSAKPMIGIMWHPERILPFRPSDIALFRRIFRVQ